MEHADHLTADKQRHAEHRLDPLLAQDRVEHVRVVDVVEDHRRSAGRDPTGEAAPDRDPHTLLDLLLDPHRRPRYELFAVLVQQQHRARVRVEDVADARQQDGEQFVELEMGERRVHDRLDVLDPLSRRRSASNALACSIAIAARSPASWSRSTSSSPNARCFSTPTWRTPITLPRDEQRNAEHRLDPLVAQDRIEHVGVVNVIEDHRATVRRDSTRETTADRNPHASLDLLLDADRRPCDELVRLLVEQQDGARVDVEHLARADEQCREE